MKVLALNLEGNLTYCKSEPSKRGIGRCNHIAHKDNSESEDDFLERISQLQKNIKNKEKTHKVIEDKVVSKNIEFSNNILPINESFINELLTSSDPDDVSDVKDVLDSFYKYAECVYYHSSYNTKAKKDYGNDINAFHNAIEKIDQKRHSIHNVAIGSFNLLNRLAKIKGAEKFYDLEEMKTDDLNARREVRKTVLKLWNERIRVDIHDIDFSSL